MMFSSSLTVMLTGLLLGFMALAAFAWAWYHGQFDHLEAQSHMVFDAMDDQIDRPWETPLERAERRARHGALVAPAPGEWGGAE